ncbi:putative lipoprotein [Hyphomonas polymorpha PS728]|uniref:Putative lipoprotein n=1 Tax=Hyphomonas polymorpha PS728 TaxID=1280954 RepID=A0A062V9U5_9PROT|nr:hypothetical protein [Hyphomonas polymorpha]KCZ96910.1 putative lipoprotein [Hyphomonas polymorpha PS728]
MRRVFAVISAILPALAVACVYAPEGAPPPPQPATFAVPAPPPPARFVALTATLPHGPSEGLPPSVLDPIQEGAPLRLDLTLLPPLIPSIRQPDGTYVLAESCDFGVVEAGAVSLPTGSYHMLINAELGTPSANPASLLSCEYDPALMSDDSPGASWRLRGCFLPQAVSIPTATLWALSPLPASACGIGN